MRTPKLFEIDPKSQKILEGWCRSTKQPQGQIMRAKIILQLNDGLSPSQVAIAQRTSAKTVHRWRNRFEEAGVDGLLERPRSGRP